MGGGLQPRNMKLDLVKVFYKRRNKTRGRQPRNGREPHENVFFKELSYIH